MVRLAEAKRARREREQAHAREEIVAAAARAFARRGLRHTTMEDIAAEAGYATSSLYTYFRGKEELLVELINVVSRQFVSVREQPIPQLPFRERLCWLLSRQCEVVERNRDFFVMFFAHRGAFELGGECEADRCARDGHLRWLAFMAQFLEQGMKEGEIRQGDPTALARLVVASVHATIIDWVASKEASLVGRVPELVALLVDGIGAERTRRAR